MIRIIKGLLVTLPIHLFTALASLFIYGIYQLFFDYDFEVTVVSLFLLVFNTVSYFLYSYFFLRKFTWNTVLSSTLLFLLIGLALWIIADASFDSDFLETAFWYYHVAGYTSYEWYEKLFVDPYLFVSYDNGYLYSTGPALIILIGYTLGRLRRKK